ncbi:MAG: hypothetical protein R6U22_09095 [Desulfohalobiaceae bacterium]
MQYQAGQRLDSSPPSEGQMPILSGPSLDIFAFYSRLSTREIKDWSKGRIRQALFVEKSIPFLLLDLGRSWSLELYLNMHQESETDRQEFFQGDPQQTGMGLILVSCPEAVVQAVRRIEPDSRLMLRLKEDCFDQLTRYASSEECFVEAEMILQRNDSRSMRKNSVSF